MNLCTETEGHAQKQLFLVLVHGPTPIQKISYGICHKRIHHIVFPFPTSECTDRGCTDCKVLKWKLVILGYINKLDLT